MPHEADALEAAEIFRGLSPEAMRAIEPRGTPVRLKSGAFLFRLGDQADKLYVLRRGRVSLTLPIELRGVQQDAFVEEKGPGNIVGWSSLVPPHRYTLTAQASVDSELTAFSGPELRDLADVDPAVGVVVMRNLATLMGRRMHEVQAMWIRELQRSLDARYR